MIKELIAYFYSDEKVKDAYTKAGFIFGDMLSLVQQGDQCDNYNEVLANYTFWEKQYVKRGFQSIPTTKFISLSSESIDDLLMKKSDIHILYATEFKEVKK